eukprot:SAG11_NODE_2475_length_3316_cov_2.668635_4_plen_45_part_01
MNLTLVTRVTSTSFYLVLINKPIHKLAKFILEGSRRYLLDSCTNI